MSAESDKVSPSPSPSAAPRYPIINDSSPSWLLSGPLGLQDNHEDPSKDIFTTEKDGKHWSECRAMLKSHDTKVLDDWKDEISTQLLVSSLLAAVAGGFSVESQKRLSEDPAVTSAVVLLQIARQLNESIGVPATELVAFSGPSHVEKTFNSLFYTSLGLSLANVTIGLLCLQWIRGMVSEPPGMPSSYPKLRYIRHLGFERWGAKAIISSLPLVLLAALLAFFAGLLVLASDSDWISSIPLYIILPFVVAIVLFTTFAPGLVIVLNMAFRNVYDFPSLPPFRSLQSWIVMQGFIRIFQATSGVIKLNPFGGFTPLRRCLDWGQVDRLWSGWSYAGAQEVFMFPLVLSTGAVKDLNTIFNIIEDVWQLNDSDSTPKLRKMVVLIVVFYLYGRTLPETTCGSIVGLFLDELAGIINVGVPLDSFSFPFDVDEVISLDFAPVESTRQLINSLSFLCRTGTHLNEAIWNLFWKALAVTIQSSDMKRPDVGPILFSDVLASMKIALETPSTDTEAVFQRGFKFFIEALAYEVERERGWTRLTTHSDTDTHSLILSHSIWVPAREIIETLPPGEHSTAAQKCMRTLDRMRQKFPPRPLTPLEEPSTPPDEPVDSGALSEREDGLPTTSPHISIDIEPKHDEEHGTTSVPASSPVAGDTGPDDEDEDAGGTEDKILLDQGPPTTTTIPSPFALPTPPIDSPTPPPGPPLL